MKKYKYYKKKHTKGVSVCWNFVAGSCEYEDSFCWFAHERNKGNMMQFHSKCNICDLTFNNRAEYLKHRKKFHIDIVPECKNKMEGACQYSDESSNIILKNMIEKNKLKVKR